MVKYLLVLILSTFVLGLSTACEPISDIDSLEVYWGENSLIDTSFIYEFAISKSYGRVIPCTLYVYTIDTTGWYRKWDEVFWPPLPSSYSRGAKVVLDTACYYWITRRVWRPVLDTVIVKEYEVDCGLDKAWFPVKLKGNRWMGLK